MPLCTYMKETTISLARMVHKQKRCILKPHKTSVLLVFLYVCQYDSYLRKSKSTISISK